MSKKKNREIFNRVALKLNKDFNQFQFEEHNKSLFNIIMKAMEACQKEKNKTAK